MSFAFNNDAHGERVLVLLGITGENVVNILGMLRGAKMILMCAGISPHYVLFWQSVDSAALVRRSACPSVTFGLSRTGIRTLC